MEPHELRWHATVLVTQAPRLVEAAGLAWAAFGDGGDAAVRGPFGDEAVTRLAQLATRGNEVHRLLLLAAGDLRARADRIDAERAAARRRELAAAEDARRRTRPTPPPTPTGGHLR